MNARRSGSIAATLGLLAVTGVLVAGCGGSSDSSSTTSTSTTTSTSSSGSAQERIDAAVQSCTEHAQTLSSDAGGAALAAACSSVGDSVKTALANGGAQAQQALQQAADSCQSSVSQLPAGDAQNYLSDLCAAIAG